jgi:DNA-directed RNA polymerase beta subunit
MSGYQRELARQLYALVYFKYEDDRMSKRENDKMAENDATNTEGLEHNHDRVFNDAAFKNGAGVLLARVPWKGHNFQDAVYYMLDNPGSSMGIYPLTLPVK